MCCTREVAVDWAWCWAIALSVSLAVGQTLHAAAPKLDASYVTPGVVFAMVVHPRRVLTAPEMDVLPIEVFSAAGKKTWGIDPIDVEQVLFIAEVQGDTGSSSGAFVLRLARPYSLAIVAPTLRNPTTEATLEGRAYLRGADPKSPSLYMPDDRTLLSASRELLERMVSQRAKPAAGTMSRLLASTDAADDLLAVFTMDPIRHLASTAMAEVSLSPELEPARRLPELVNKASIRVNVLGRGCAMLSVCARDEAAAKELEVLVGRLLQKGEQLMLAVLANQPESDDPVQQAMAQYTRRMSLRTMQKLLPVRQGDRLELTIREDDPEVRLFTTLTLLAKVVPAIKAVYERTRQDPLPKTEPSGTLFPAFRGGNADSLNRADISRDTHPSSDVSGDEHRRCDPTPLPHTTGTPTMKEDSTHDALDNWGTSYASVPSVSPW